MQDEAGERGLLFKVENDVRYSLHPQCNLEHLRVIKGACRDKGEIHSFGL
ncbi:TPA: hypothetical protein NH575_005283 [Pseudomonas aeruginosa]|nr:hypothetical protein [Pseudomonas aeruginosa]HBO0014482.1 hypothetical protein [Pseudomonas aeruginosa]HBO0258985.1 hypothetical protein [Pseudomonas aeruginosa]HBO0271640.1 hypothetical protein [Pseudomonas aeruginosa]HBO2826766.1 hypothetical protein [Pseudomonas aeruginosa]HCF0065479.1 hypothetical protein [Pseudomonas aeruginosa]